MSEVDTSDNDALPLGELSKDRRLPPLLRRAWYSLNQSFRRQIAHLGITPNQYTILRWLHEMDAQGPTQRQPTELMASDPKVGEMWELNAIAAVVVGGTSLFGGRGTIVGTLIGALIIGVLNNTLNLLHVDHFWQKVVLGLVILGAALLDSALRRLGRQ